jgi:RNA polymerase sigma-70 factor (ECF subfamily)
LENATVFLHQDLVNRCRTGDRDAHYQLYKLYSKAMFNVALRIVIDEEEAQDVLQESFISAFKNLDKYRGDAAFGTWLKRIVINKGVNALHKKKHDRMPDHEEWDFAEEEQSVAPETLAVERVKQGIDQLPDGYRMVLSLYLIEGYDHQEIGEILGISESTSKSQLNRAKAKLRVLLEGVKRSSL